MKNFILLIALFITLQGFAQRNPDEIYVSNIKTVKLFQQNNQQSLPVIRLNSEDQVELHFDDLDGEVKNYYYSLELCNADWTPADLSPFDYIKGFTQIHLSEYRASSITLCKYIHYQAFLPDNNCIPTKSGNYMLRVFLDGDTANTVCTKRLYVVENKVVIGVQMQQPFDFAIAKTHQKLQFSINTLQLNVLNPQQQMHVVVLQNYRWDNAVMDIQPAFIRDNILEYNGEQDCIFQGGREYRWIDVRSFHFATDKVYKINNTTMPYEVFLKPEGSRIQQRFLFLKNYYGWNEISTTELTNQWWQTDYGWVYFTYVPTNNQPFNGKDMYLMGDLTGNRLSNRSKMNYNAEKGVYEKKLYLKQGFYSYTYATVQQKNNAKADVSVTDGSFWETDNQYTILVYYRSLSDRHDKLVAMSSINSRNLNIGN